MFPDSSEIKGLMTNDPYALFGLLGTFWQKYVSDRDDLKVHEFAHNEIQADVLRRADVMDAAASIFTVEPYRTQQWWALELRESGLVVAPNVITYGSGLRFGEGAVYGQLIRNSYSWFLPTTLKGLGIIVDKLLTPTVVFDISNMSFNPTTGVLRFDQNPFELLQPKLLFDASGAPVMYRNAQGAQVQDRAVLLWIRNPAFDQNDIFLRFGSIIKVAGTSSQAYQGTVEAVWRTLMMGPSMDALWRGLLASAGLAYVAGAETVQSVGPDSENLVVVTDLNVYKAALSATALVAVGDALTAGQQIFDTVELIDLSSGKPVDITGLAGLVLDGHLINGGVTVTAPNLPSTWTVTPDPGHPGRPQYRFELIGAAADIETFWDTVQANGIAAGQTLGEALKQPAGTPVNPAEFFLTQFFNGKLVVILLKPQSFLSQEVGFLNRIRTLLPAGVLVLTQIALGTIEDTLDVSGATDTIALYPVAGAADAVAVYSGTGPLPGAAFVRDYQPTVWNA